MMQKLPALPTFREVVAIEALAFARDWIAEHRKPNGRFHPDANYVKDLMKEYAQFHPFNCDEICYFAANGSKEADLALRELYAERSDRGEDPGVVLTAYIIRLINPARGRSGPGKAADFIRDMGITVLLQALMDRFQDQLPMNRSSDSAGPSFSSVAAQALCEAKIGILDGLQKRPEDMAEVSANSGRYPLCRPYPLCRWHSARL
jgi:hypothetical protein